MADVCSPALWANTEAPTNGCCGFGAMFTSSEMWWATGVSSGSRSDGIVATLSLSDRSGTTAARSALPARSPYPFTHPGTWVAPTETPASEFATAQPLSSWKCTPTWDATGRAPW